MALETSKIFGKELLLVGALMLLLAVFFIFLALASEGVYGGADTYLHYSIAHYAFKHPHLFVDHWGKPLFTALASPFAQMGFVGLQVFNIIISLLSALLSYKVCKLLKLQYAWLSIILILFAPVYFILVFTGLTETLFGFVLILGVYLFFRKKYFLAALVISFLPFARTEGFIILPLFALALVSEKKWLPILLLPAGFAFYSLVGYFHYHDFLWFFTQNPYTGAVDIYGRGSLWHFVVSCPEIFGVGATLLILCGIIGFISPFISQKKSGHLPVTEVLLVLLPASLYFAAHSYLWWKGLNGSLGLIRVIAGIIPLTGIIGLKGANLFLPFIQKQTKTFILIGVFLFGFIIYEPFRLYSLPFPNGPEEKVLDEAARWIEKEKLDQHKMYSVNSYLFFKLNCDPYDNNKVSMSFPPQEQISNYVLPGELVIWDAHFGPNEGRIDLNSLLNNKYFLLRAIFLPDQSFVTMGGRPYEVYVFQRTTDTSHAENVSILGSLRENYYTKKQVYLNTFDNTRFFVGDRMNNSCFQIKSDIEFSPGMDTLLKKCNTDNNLNFEVCVDIFPIKKDLQPSIDLVSSVTSPAKTYAYNSFTIHLDKLPQNQWSTVQLKFILPEINDDKAIFKAYIWNNNKAEVCIDNLKVSVIEKNN